MSGFKPVGTELLYAYFGAATTSTPTASPGSSMIVGYPACQIPAGYFDDAGSSWASSMRLVMGGLLTATATIPTWQIQLNAVVTANPAAFSTTSPVTIAQTAAFTPSAATANVPWLMEVHIGLRTMALGAASTVVGWGEIRATTIASAAYAVATPENLTLPTAGAYTPASTYDVTQTYNLWPTLILGAGTAGNTVTTQFMKLYGEN